MLLCTDLTTELKIENLSQNAGRISNSVPKYLTRNLLFPFFSHRCTFPFSRFSSPLLPLLRFTFPLLLLLSPLQNEINGAAASSRPDRSLAARSRHGRVLAARSRLEGRSRAATVPRRRLAAISLRGRGTSPRSGRDYSPVPWRSLRWRGRAVTPPAILRGAATGLCFYIIQKFFYNL